MSFIRLTNKEDGTVYFYNFDKCLWFAPEEDGTSCACLTDLGVVYFFESAEYIEANLGFSRRDEKLSHAVDRAVTVPIELSNASGDGV